jgi:CHAT domain-containing protein
VRTANNARPENVSRWWVAITFLAIVTAIGALKLLRHERSDLERLIDATAAMRVRPIEARLSGFPYGRYQSPTHASLSFTPAQRQLRGIAAHIAASSWARSNVYASAVAHLVAGQGQSAVDLMEQTVREHPANAAAWSDLAAARYELASGRDDVPGFISSAAAAETALRMEPSFEEAAFNRALAWDAAHEVYSAERAYQHFLMLSSSPEWSQEARERLAKLQASKSHGTWKSSLPAIEAAAQQGNRERIAQFVSQFPEETRTWSEAEFLGRWASAEATGDRSEGDKHLLIARQLADALREANGEYLVADAIAAVDHATPRQRAELVEGHRDYRDGRRLYSQRRLIEAAPLLNRAALHFRNGGSPMSAVASYYAANLAVDAGRIADASALAATAAQRTSPRYRALNAELEWLRGTMEGREGHLFEALRAYTAAAATFAALGEANNNAYMSTSAATILTRLGRDAEAWRAKRDAWAYFGKTGDARSLQIALIAAADGEVVQSRFDSARTLLTAALQLSREAQNPRAESTALVWRALCGIRVAPGNTALELSVARERARGLSDPDLRVDALDRVRIAEATATSDAPLAARLLTESIDFARRRRQLLNLPNLLLQRGRKEVELGDLHGAIEDFSRAAKAVEERRSEVTADDLRDSYFGTEREIYSALADALQRSGLTQDAFDVAERRYARVILDRRLAEQSAADSTLPITELKRRLPKGVTVLEFIAAGDHLLRFRLDRASFVCDVLQISPARLGALVDQFREAIEHDDVSTARRDGEVLYDAVLGSVARGLTPSDRLMIVTDEPLGRLPFGALFDRSTQQYLAEQLSFVLAPSANLFIRSLTFNSRGNAGDAMIVADPAIDGRSFSRLERLPGAAAEAERLRFIYPTARVLTGNEATVRAVLEAANVSVLHFATHAVLNDREPAQSCLVLAPAKSDSGALYLHEIARLRLTRLRLVMLAGCRTGVAANGGHGDVRSLATAFVMAGAGSVAASLWDVDDDAEREFSIQVHLNMRQKSSAAEALRSAQLMMLHSTNPRFNSLRAWSGMEIFGTD